jgi:hypothetical protein
MIRIVFTTEISIQIYNFEEKKIIFNRKTVNNIFGSMCLKEFENKEVLISFLDENIGNLNIYNISKKELHTIKCDETIKIIQFSNSGEYLTIVPENGTIIKIINVKNGNILKTFKSII